MARQVNTTSTICACTRFMTRCRIPTAPIPTSIRPRRKRFSAPPTTSSRWSFMPVSSRFQRRTRTCLLYRRGAVYPRHLYQPLFGLEGSDFRRHLQPPAGGVLCRFRVAFSAGRAPVSYTDEVQYTHGTYTNLYSASKEAIFGATYNLQPVEFYAGFESLSAPDAHLSLI